MKTEVEVDVSYNSVKPNGYDYESRTSKCVATWQLNLDVRSAFASINIYSNNQDISFNLEVLKDEQEDPTEVTFNMTVRDIEVEKPENYNEGFCAQTMELKILSLSELPDGSFKGEATGRLVF